MTIGQRIKKRRKELKLSAEELASKIGKDRATVFRYENGDIEKLPYDILFPIAKALDISPSYLIGWEEPEEEKKSDIASDIAARLIKDKEFLELVEKLNKLDKEKIQGVKHLLDAFL